MNKIKELLKSIDTSVFDEEDVFELLLAALMETGRNEEESAVLIHRFYIQQKKIDDAINLISNIYNEAKESLEDYECQVNKA